jgi:alpha-1,2-mannosyltransferase
MENLREKVLKMSVVVTHPSLNRGGGAEKVCLTVVKVLSERGYKVRLATIDKTNWRFLEERFGKLFRPSEEIYLMENMPIKGKFSQAFSTLFCFLPELLYLRLKDEHDVIVNTYGDIVDSIADISYINALPERIKYHYPQLGFSDSVVWRFVAMAYDFSLKGVDKVFSGNILLANSRFTQSVMSKYLNRDSRVVYPPVDIEKFEWAAENAARENLVVTVSRFRQGKYLEFIPIIAKLAEGTKFTIIGLADQASQSTIKGLTKKIKSLGVKDQVKLLINQPFQKLVDVLASTKVFLHTQPTEAFGISIVEAMAAGCVPVVPRDGGPWFDILSREQGKYGYAYSSLREAAEKINLLLNDERLRTEISCRAFERAKRFDHSFFERKMVEVIHEVAVGKLKQ